ncbi:Uncharacterised protein [Mycobacteroides abscessus]|nr:Uncharacterised protein [Mycobacteroides abscessus]
MLIDRKSMDAERLQGFLEPLTITPPSVRRAVTVGEITLCPGLPSANAEETSIRWDAIASSIAHSNPLACKLSAKVNNVATEK